jgi:hypothetical protein
MATEAQAKFVPGSGITKTAEGAITEYALVGLGSSDGQAKIPAAKGVYVHGVAYESADDTTTFTAFGLGNIMPVIVTEAVIPGDELTVAATLGRAQKAVSTDWVCGIALETATGAAECIEAKMVGYVKP